MITGTVSASLEPMLSLSLQGLTRQAQQIDGVIDTGFTGFLTVTSALIASLGLPWLYRQQVTPGDGSVRLLDVHAVSVL
jgi:predicted aspartyl protease